MRSEGWVDLYPCFHHVNCWRDMLIEGCGVFGRFIRVIAPWLILNSVSVNGEFEESLSKTYVQHSAPARKNEV